MAINFEKLFDTLPSPHMLLDHDFCYAAVNSAYEEAVLRTREELLGRNLFDLFPNEGESGRQLRQSFRKVLNEGVSESLAYIPYDIPLPPEQGGGMEKRYWTAVHTPVFGDDGQVTHVMQNTVDVTELVNLRQAVTMPFRAGEIQLLERAREVEQQRRSILEESNDFKRFFQQAPGFFAVLSGPDHVFTFANDAYLQLVGGRDLIGKSVYEALPEVRSQDFIDLLDGVYNTGQPYSAEAMRIMLVRDSEKEPRETYLDFSYDAIRDDDGNVTGVFVQGMDRTDVVKTLKQQRMLLNELNHRVKNTLASVQSIVSQTLRASDDPEQARHDIQSRLSALSNAHNLLSAQQWTSARFHDIASQELSVFDASRVTMDGPQYRLSPKASISIAMLLHELATNAVKYGALSTPEGHVDLRWRKTDDGKIAMEWRELGGPEATTPSRRGFGTRLIEGIVEGELNGAYTPNYAPDGFSCSIVMDEKALSGS